MLPRAVDWRAASSIGYLESADHHKALLVKDPPPYSESELDSIARNCTLKEDAARKVERAMGKRVAAVAMHRYIGQTFAAVVTGRRLFPISSIPRSHARGIAIMPAASISLRMYAPSGPSKAASAALELRNA